MNVYLILFCMCVDVVDIICMSCVCVCEYVDFECCFVYFGYV